ncbi:DNA polymerase III subunit gamma/tau [Candidatus Annandia adelgestsuga]|uniref:DNA polymerase III subunit gamma/tau n=1 Tax=Candidatus Annandia adelgestsuga TaxID=1302411 RepID=UPI000F7F0DE4|nr:DNA polymerase III subunit gamma/tau [Candidatus Annandia adelgestsuga]
MNNLILSLKYRPQSLNEIIGQKYTVNAIKNSLDMNYIHNIWLFSGSHGIGKTSIARILAKSLNCKIKISSKPCRKCNNCIEIEKNNFIDVIEIDGASKTKIEDIKDILENSKYPPIIGRYKIYIIDEVHMLSKYSFNAMLKILENPPKYIKFILATTEINKIPETILSRCLNFYLNKINIEEINKNIIRILKKEKIFFENEAILLLSNNSNGSMRDALNLVDQSIILGKKKILINDINKMLGIVNINISLKILEYIFYKKNETLINFINNIYIENVNWELFLLDIINILHKIYLFKFNIKINKDDKYYIYYKKIKNISKISSYNKIKLYYKILIKGRKNLYLAPNLKIGFEMIILEILTI